MNRKLCIIAAALLPCSFLFAQQPAPQTPQQQAPQQQPAPRPNRPGFRTPSPEAMRKIAEQRQQMRDHADARHLVDLVAQEFSDELPSRWATQPILSRIAQAEFKSAVDPGALITEQRIADAWNQFVKKIGAPPDTLLTAADVHYLRDAQYVTSRSFWFGYDQRQIWTIPNIFAAGPDRKIAPGSRPLEAIQLLWLLGSNEDDFAGIHAAAQKGVLFSDLLKQQAKSSSGQAQTGYATARIVSFSPPVAQAALRYQRAHGAGAFNRAIKDLLNNLLDS